MTGGGIEEGERGGKESEGKERWEGKRRGKEREVERERKKD